MILWLTCTFGRFKCLQRNLKCYLDQDTQQESVMFICNSGAPLKLPDNFIVPRGKNIYIDNCHLLNIQTVGEKYAHALHLATQLYPDIDIINSADDDDIFMPDHLSQGYRGMQLSLSQDKYAYKPKLSYFRYRENGAVKYTRNENTYEPSIFVKADWIKEKGYAPVSIKYHQQWLVPLVEQDKILVDLYGKSTLIYNWGDDWQTYKMSGSATDNQNNFNAHKRSSTDMGNGILTPAEDNNLYYKFQI